MGYTAVMGYRLKIMGYSVSDAIQNSIYKHIALRSDSKAIEIVKMLVFYEVMKTGVCEKKS